MGLNFKRVSELGLEIIQLEGQILLVDKLEHTKDRLILHQSINGKVNHFYKSDEIDLDDYNSRRFLGLTFNVIASTKPLEELPLLVIEDEVDEIIDQEMIKMGHEPSKVRHPIFGEDRELAKALYYKAKETYKFTEEDLRKAIQLGNDFCDVEGDDAIPELVISDFLESITKKELWVEAHWDCCSRCIDGVDECTATWELKIEKGQIKATYR